MVPNGNDGQETGERLSEKLGKTIPIESLRPGTLLHQRPGGNSAYALIQSGKTLADNLRRAVFQDWNDMRDLLLFKQWCERHDVDTTLVEDFLAAATAVGGRSRKEFVQTAVGIVSPQLYTEDGKAKPRMPYPDGDKP